MYLITEFNKSAREFFIHVYKTTHQYEYFDKLQDNLPQNAVFLLADFSKNYEAKYHEEIQAVHFGASKNHITLHTGVFLFKDTEEKLIL